MKVDPELLALIAACAAVTFFPRILPFAVVRRLVLPAAFQKWLSYIPLCLLTALLVQGLLRPTATGAGVQIDWLSAAIAVPTLLAAVRTRSLLPTVVVGVLCAALFRWLHQAIGG